MHYLKSYLAMLALIAPAAGCSGSSNNSGTGTGGTTAASSSLGGNTSSNSGGAATGGSLASVTGGNGGAGVSGGNASTGGIATAGGTTSTGGNVATGGSATIGGSTATGGKTATGGSVAVGGTTTAGGAATGGKSATGGSAATGGKSGVGGTTAGGNTSTGGSSAATGGRSSTGGTSAATGGRSSTGGSTGTAGSSAYHPCPTDGTACKIMPFGDSITDGYNADTPGGYRVELFRLAHSGGKNITFVGSGYNGPATVDGVAFPHNHEGHSGWTIYPAGSRSGISSCLVASTVCNTTQSVMTTYTPHIVLLMIGTNDAIDNYDMANAPTRLGNLIDTIYTQLPNVLIVVAQPIPSRGNASLNDDTGLSARIKTYDDAIPAVVAARANAGKHILVVDMYTPFNPNKAALMEDQWHPNLAGYVVLGTQWYSVLQPLI